MNYRLALVAFAFVIVTACNATAVVPPEAAAVKQKYGAYTPERASSERYVRDDYCLDASALGLPAERGAMGFHATNSALLRGPIDVNVPQALMFDAQGRILGVEYEVTTDAVREAPRLFDRTFTKMGAHPGIEGEHYALHFWFVENPNGPFDDFNPRVACPPGTTPPAGERHPAVH